MTFNQYSIYLTTDLFDVNFLEGKKYKNAMSLIIVHRNRNREEKEEERGKERERHKCGNEIILPDVFLINTL